jgi:hypothetical protein
MKERQIEIIKEIEKFPHEKENIEKYLKELNEIEWKAYLLARDILKTSFHLLKSNGYIEWKSLQK